MNDARNRRIERFQRLLDDDKVYEALRESLALRPPPHELIDRFMRRQTAPAGFFRETAHQLVRPSDRAGDPGHPVGSIAIAIQRALPHFHVWSLDAGEAAARLLTFTGEYQDRLRAVLPPGFAEGRPGAFVRATRALVVLDENGGVRSIYEHLQGSPNEEAFKSAGQQIRMSDVLDLTWMATGLVELRAVQELLAGLISTVLPSTRARFSSYDEPRYRAALQLHLDEVAARAASGGVLTEWPGRPENTNAAHVRIFLEPWATVRSGCVVEFERILDPRIA